MYIYTCDNLVYNDSDNLVYHTSVTQLSNKGEVH